MERAGAEDMPEEAERKGLGTPATRAAILEKLVQMGFGQRKGKQLVPTKDGINPVSYTHLAAGLDADRVILFFLEAQDFCIPVHQHFQCRGLHPAHGQDVYKRQVWSRQGSSACTPFPPGR